MGSYNMFLGGSTKLYVTVLLIVCVCDHDAILVLDMLNWKV